MDLHVNNVNTNALAHDVPIVKQEHTVLQDIYIYIRVTIIQGQLMSEAALSLCGNLLLSLAFLLLCVLGRVRQL